MSELVVFFIVTSIVSTCPGTNWFLIWSGTKGSGTEEFLVWNQEVYWTEDFLGWNWAILGAEKKWPFCVELMCWTEEDPL